MKLLSIAASLVLSLSTAAFADHSVDNAPEIARASYRAAESAEMLEQEAFRDARGGVFEDHRRDSLLELAQDARRLHLSLSDLYRAARDSFGGFEAVVTPEDHRGDRIRSEFARAEADFRDLQQTYYSLNGYSISNRIHSIYNSVEGTFANLQWLVYGR